MSAELHHCPGELIKSVAALKDEFPGAKVVPARDPLHSLVSDDIDAVPVKAESPARKAARGRAGAALKALEKFK